MIKTKIPVNGTKYEIDYVSVKKETEEKCPKCGHDLVYEQLVDIDQITDCSTDRYVATSTFDGQYIVHYLALMLMGKNGHCINPHCLAGYRCEAPAKY